MHSYRSHAGGGANEVRDRWDIIGELLRECKHDVHFLVWSTATIVPCVRLAEVRGDRPARRRGTGTTDSEWCPGHLVTVAETVCHSGRYAVHHASAARGASPVVNMRCTTAGRTGIPVAHHNTQAPSACTL